MSGFAFCFVQYRPAFGAGICLLVLGLLATAFTTLHPGQLTFVVDDSSKLYLTGESNVNAFTCNCRERFDTQNFQVDVPKGGGSSRFSRSVFYLTTKQFDCGHKGMNKDLYDALKANQYPKIAIELNEVAQKGGQGLENSRNWVELGATATITIANQSRREYLNAKGLKIGPNRYRFQSEHTIRMTDYGIEPPKALFGLIQVKNNITIHFDLVVNLVEKL